MLAKEVLQEVPNQLVQYFQEKNIVPNPANPLLRQQKAIKAAMDAKIASNFRGVGVAVPSEEDWYEQQKCKLI